MKIASISARKNCFVIKDRIIIIQPLKRREKLKEKRVRERERVKSVSEREGRRKVFFVEESKKESKEKSSKGKKFRRKLEYFDISPNATIIKFNQRWHQTPITEA